MEESEPGFQGCIYENKWIERHTGTEMLTFGKGPKLQVGELDGPAGKVNGTTTSLKDPATGKLSPAEGGKGLITLDNDVVNMYENASTMGSGSKVMMYGGEIVQVATNQIGGKTVVSNAWVITDPVTEWQAIKILRNVQ